MSEAEKQEGQKTVVAFITGLLIGGLLVWVFSSTPQDSAVVTTTDEEAKEAATNTEETKDTAVITTEKTAEVAKPAAVAGNGSLTVVDQAAGKSVALKAVTFPAKYGWVVVRDYMDGVPGNVLGAARYNLDEGLTPASVTLLRATEKGSSYQVVFFGDNGDKAFSLKSDGVVTGGEATFKAN